MKRTLILTSAGLIGVAAMMLAGSAGELTPRPRAAILTGAAWPRPYGDALRAIRECPPTLHLLGRADQVNPPEMGVEVAECCGGRVHWHDGGHVVPTDAASRDVIRDFLQSVAMGELA